MKAVEVRNIKIGEGIPKICVPIVGVTKEDIINEAKTFENIPVDVVEWRVDWFENVFDIEKVKDVLLFLWLLHCLSSELRKHKEYPSEVLHDVF